MILKSILPSLIVLPKFNLKFSLHLLKSGFILCLQRALDCIFIRAQDLRAFAWFLNINTGQTCSWLMRSMRLWYLYSQFISITNYVVWRCCTSDLTVEHIRRDCIYWRLSLSVWSPTSTHTQLLSFNVAAQSISHSSIMIWSLWILNPYWTLAL